MSARVTSYIWDLFDLEKALLGALVGLKVDYEGYIVDDAEQVFAYWDVSKCSKLIVDNDKKAVSNYKVIIEGTTYWIDKNGKIVQSLDTARIGKHVFLVTADLARTEGTSQGSTRGASGTTPEDVNVTLASLEPRDSFAIQILQGLLTGHEQPESYDDASILSICSSAYKWAQGMMQASANFRKLSEGTDPAPTEDQDTEKVNVDMTDTTTTDKLLNNIVAALERTDIKTGTTETPAHWYKIGYEDVEGAHTDAVAQTLPSSGDPYTGVEAAEADGWKWVDVKTASTYAEKISNPEFNTFLDNYVKHTPTSAQDTQQTVGLDDLINAIKAIGSGQGGSTEVDFSTLIAALNNTQTVAIRGSLPTITTNIGNSGIGRDDSHPLYISGGGFPNKDSLAAAITGALMDSVVSFNSSGAVGYTTKAELKNAILGYLNTYADIDALSSAVLTSLTADAIYNKILSKIDDRINAWLNTAKVTINGTDYPVIATQPS